MLKNYVLIAFRNFFRKRVFSLINILGLAIGISCSILIFLWVTHELSYDRFFDNYDNLYMVVEEQHYEGGEVFPVTATPGPLAPALTEKVPEVKAAVRFQNVYQKVMFRNDNVFFNEDKLAVADSNFFQLFSYKFVEGSPETALKKSHSMVLTQELARRYFGDKPALSKTLTLDNLTEYEITGVIEIPNNTNLDFQALIPYPRLKDFWDGVDLTSWGNNSLRTFVLLKPGTQLEALNQKIKSFIKDHHEGSVTDIYLWHWSNIHLYSIRGSGGNIVYVRIFILIALFVLLIACINFMNLSTARSANRAREVGIRKVVGAQRRQLIVQFFAESLLLTLIAFFIAFVVVEILLPVFNNLSGKELSMDYTNPYFWLGLLAIALFTGLLSGSYPALYLSRFRPVRVLKSGGKSGKDGALFRKILVIVQFSLAIILISGTIIIFKQLNFIQNRNLGFNKENLLMVQIPREFDKRYNTLRSQLQNQSDVLGISAASTYPSSIGNSTWSVGWPGKDEETKILFHNLYVDFGFAQTMGLKIVEGRAFDPSFSTDSAAVLINQEAKRRIGVEDIVGQNIDYHGYDLKVIGIVENFNFKHFSHSIEPLIMVPRKDFCQIMLIRLAGKNTKATIDKIEQAWLKISPKFPFEYQFFDQQFDQLYRSEMRMGKLFNYFTWLAIFISALGLFGLASFMTEQRRKEIAIRKVLGATVSSVWYMLVKEFVKWVALSFVIAVPLAYWGMNSWLADFAYRTQISWWAFAVAGILAMLIAVLTVSYQSLKAAHTNPSNALKYE